MTDEIDFEPYLEDLAARIDPEEERRIHSLWSEFLEDRWARQIDESEPFTGQGGAVFDCGERFSA